ncbi:MAG: flavodoxin family protein [Gammaproteobacteria bacterium]|jgi:multimeric flavodoxin WrbA
MKVVCLLGSPRVSGNSTTMARKFCEILENAGATIQYVSLNKLNYRGCQACEACKKTLEQCVLKDDLTDVLAAVQTSDVFVLASPVYFGDVSAQLKGFIDRTYSYISAGYADKIGKPDISRLKPGKKAVMIFTQNAACDYHEDIFLQYKSLFKTFLEIDDMLLIRECGFREVKDLKDHPNVMKKIESAAQQLLDDM